MSRPHVIPAVVVVVVVLLLLLPPASAAGPWAASRSSRRQPGPRQIVTRNATGVRLERDRGLIEIVEEQTCSASLVRLTCRSLDSFVFVLEARYQPNRTDACVYDRETWCRHRPLFATVRSLQLRRHFLRSNYPRDTDENTLDFLSTINRRCAGHGHCRYRVMSEHPEALFWKPANIRIKYACIPEAAVYKYCNANIDVPAGVGGYLKSPGYPLYYLGEMTCGWTFRALPGQRIVLTFYDLSIRDREADGSCVDVVRVREHGSTLYETCGSAAGVKVTSNTNVVTLNIVASAMLYPARGFFMQYQVLGCPDVQAPPGSYVSNGTLETRTFLCRAGTLFPDVEQRTRTIHCRAGRWEENIHDLPACTDVSSTLILNSEDNMNQFTEGGNSESSTDGVAETGFIDQGTRIDRGPQDAVAKTTNYSIMDQAQPTMIKGPDYALDLTLPTVLIALLFVVNAIIVYIIFHYRKRNVDNNFRKIPSEVRGQEIALNAMTNGDHQV